MRNEQAQLAGDGTYPWDEKFHGKNLLNQKRAKNYKPRKNNKGLKMSNAPKIVNGIKCANFYYQSCLLSSGRLISDFG